MRKPIIQRNLDGSFVRRWSGACEVSDELGFSKTALSMACNRRHDYEDGVAYGYRWDFEGVDYETA